MDPKQALLDAFSALKDGDTERKSECLKAYYNWRLNGGFEPIFDGINGDYIYWVVAKSHGVVKIFR